MNWWEESFIHIGWNDIAEKISPKLAETTAAAEFFKIEVKPSIIEKYWSSAPWYIMLSFLLIPFIWYKYHKNRRFLGSQKSLISEDKKKNEK